MKLVWSQTGDSLDLDLDNPVVAEYWVDQLTRDQKNQFVCTEVNIPNTQELVDALTAVNAVLEKIKLDPLMDPACDWINQDNLNILHERWVKIQYKHKNIVNLISKFPNNVIEQFHNVNLLIHKIENPIKASYINDQRVTWQTPNIFGPEIAKFGVWQAEIHYQNLGRSNYEKWKNYDSNLIDTDTNNFTHIGGLVYFNIGHPVLQSPPANYVEYCQQHNISPYGNKLPLGNFKISITDLRHIFNKNVNIKNNTITFEV
jgi:hypothetical protein